MQTLFAPCTYDADLCYPNINSHVYRVRKIHTIAFRKWISIENVTKLDLSIGFCRTTWSYANNSLPRQSYFMALLYGESVRAHILQAI